MIRSSVPKISAQRIDYVCLTFLLLMLSAFLVKSQSSSSIQGKVVDPEGKPLAFVNVGIQGINKGASTNYEGAFHIKDLEAGTYRLYASYVGFQSYSKRVKLEAGEVYELKIKLKKEAIEQKEVVVTGTMQETYVQESPVKVEVINQQFLEHDPENNIINSLNQVNGVQQQVNCGVCGTNAIRINGMEGPYTLVLIDGMPIMSNLASVYGFNGIPNSMVKQMEVVKGPSSTLYGSQAVAGVINVRTKDPKNMPILSLNSYYTSHRELNTDFTFASEVGADLHTTFSGNYFRNQKKYDFNGDQFMDLTLNDRLSLFNKWQLDRPGGKKASLAVRYYRENRNGGTMPFEQEMRGNDSIYGESIKTRRVEVFGTYDLPLEADVKIDYSFSHHNQDSYYGTEYYKAKQSTAFSNLIWNKGLGSHNLLTGITMRYQTYEDNSPVQSDQKELVPGIFVQDEWKAGASWSLLGGARLDLHEKHGLIFSPRLNTKYKFTKWTTARLNLGTGFRQVHLFTEDHAAMTGSREVHIQENLDPESSYNATFNLNHIYQMDQVGSGTLDMDLFYTYFTNKIIPDYETDQDAVIYRNLKGHSVSRGAALNVAHEFSFPLKVKMGGTFQEVFEVFEDEQGEQVREAQEFAPDFTGNFTLDYKVRKWKMSFAYTGKVVGSQELPAYPPGFERAQTSDWYSLHNLKISKKVSHRLQLYGGIKNIFSWTQETPLVDPAHPFGDHFDTIWAYGPLQPRRFYLGFQWHWDE